MFHTLLHIASLPAGKHADKQHAAGGYHRFGRGKCEPREPARDEASPRPRPMRCRGHAAQFNSAATCMDFSVVHSDGP